MPRCSRASTRPSARPRHGSRANRSERKPGSISAAPTGRACCSEVTAVNISRRRATANASTIPCSSPSRSIRRIGDAYFGLGLYHYYAAIAPRAARILSMLMFLPGGDRAGGLKEMEQTRSKGLLLRGEADYQLHLIYLWYEKQPMTALRLIEGLRTRYPTNPVFYLRLAEVQGNYIRNHQAALQTYRSMLEAARAGRIAAPALSEVYARLGMAQEMDALCDSAGAVEQLNAVIALKPAAPYGALARAYYQLGVVHDRAGRRADAMAAYQRARAANPRDDRLRMREKIRAGIARAPVDRARAASPKIF